MARSARETWPPIRLRRRLCGWLPVLPILTFSSIVLPTAWNSWKFVDFLSPLIDRIGSEMSRKVPATQRSGNEFACY